MKGIVPPTASSPLSVYDLALAYDIAIDFRDLASECDALDGICKSCALGSPRSFLDLACGPGYHCIEYARRGLRSCGLDLNPTMLKYARAKAEAMDAKVEFVLADMRHFALNEPVDLAFCAMSSFHHLLTNHDVLDHLRSVAQSLTPRGIYVIEADHPRDVFRLGQSLKHEWESRREETIVRTFWGRPDDPFDPITQTSQVAVRIEVEGNGGSESHAFVTPYRHLTMKEMELLIDVSGVFEAVAWLGVLDVNRPMTNDKLSNRMVPVLRKRAEKNQA